MPIPTKKDQDIRIDMSYENKRLTIVITDTGISFNPLERQEPDLTLSLEERPTGGLGIYLVKQLMTEVSYSRSAGKNYTHNGKRHLLIWQTSTLEI